MRVEKKRRNRGGNAHTVAHLTRAMTPGIIIDVSITGIRNMKWGKHVKVGTETEGTGKIEDTSQRGNAISPPAALTPITRPGTTLRVQIGVKRNVAGVLTRTRILVNDINLIGTTHRRNTTRRNIITSITIRFKNQNTCQVLVSQAARHIHTIDTSTGMMKGGVIRM